jgi:toxin ParE1/3/4
MAVRISPQAEAELDDIWYYIATESGSIEVAQQFVNAIDDQFLLLAKHPFLGRRRDDLKPGLRSINVGDYVVIYRVDVDDALVLHVLHGHRDIRSMLQ